MRALGGAAFIGTLAATSAAAGPWAVNDGDSQIIIKYEDGAADHGFDPAGQLLPLPAERMDRALTLFAEYGLTDRITLQLKTDWQRGRDAFVDYEGRGPLEIGARWQGYRDDKTAVAVYAGYAFRGEGRNAGYEAPGMGDGDAEVRLLVGRSFAVPTRWAPEKMFVTAELARRLRTGLADETRGEITIGAEPSRNWLFLTQFYGGVTDNDGARWLTSESSVVRHFGPWSVQAGWRQTLSGRETPDSSGFVVGLWRRF